MIKSGETNCPDCHGELKYFDCTKRIMRTKYRKTEWVIIKRFKCKKCGKTHRELPDDILPFKQYETELIKGVVEGLINSDTFGFEDYPCETTMKAWRSQYN